MASNLRQQFPGAHVHNAATCLINHHIFYVETPQVCFIEIIFRIITLTIYYAEVGLGIHMDVYVYTCAWVYVHLFIYIY